MQIQYDLTVGALYISLSDHAVVRTQEIDDNTAIDLDGDGTVVGIEVVSMAHPWPLPDILARYTLPPGEEAQIRAYFLLRESPDPVQELPVISIASPVPASAV